MTLADAIYERMVPNLKVMWHQSRGDVLHPRNLRKYSSFEALEAERHRSTARRLSWCYGYRIVPRGAEGDRK